MEFTIILNNWPIDFIKLRWIDIYLSLLFIFTIIFLLAETRHKIIKIIIDRNTISKRNFLTIIQYNFGDFDGFQTSIINSKNGSYEYLYLVKDNKKLIKISEQYHKNYFEMKDLINQHSKFLGDTKFKYWHEVKEMFT